MCMCMCPLVADRSLVERPTEAQPLKAADLTNLTNLGGALSGACEVRQGGESVGEGLHSSITHLGEGEGEGEGEGDG